MIIIDKTKDNLVHDILNIPASELISKWIIDSIPFICNNDYSLHIKWKHYLARQLKIDPNDIIMSGSASVGFSLSPYKTLLKEFTPASDIDIGIISGYYFDIAWHELREFKINSSKISMSMKTAIEEHRLRYIYWGTIATDRILPLLSFGQDWDNAMRGLKKYEGFGSRDIKFRIYKDNKSFRDYITQGIIKCRDNLMEGKYEKLS